MRGSGEDLIIILSYVDDNLTLGKPKARERFLEELKQTEFTFTVEENLMVIALGYLLLIWANEDSVVGVDQ